MARFIDTECFSRQCPVQFDRRGVRVRELHMSAAFDDQILQIAELNHMEEKMFVVWDGNHKLHAWREWAYRERFDEFSTPRVECTLVALNPTKMAEFLLVLSMINKVTRVHVSHTTAHDIFKMQKLGLADPKSILDKFDYEDRAKAKRVPCGTAMNRFKWLRLPMVLLSQLLWKEEFDRMYQEKIQNLPARDMREYVDHEEDYEASYAMALKATETFFVRKGLEIAVIANPDNGSDFFRLCISFTRWAHHKKVKGKGKSSSTTINQPKNAHSPSTAKGRLSKTAKGRPSTSKKCPRPAVSESSESLEEQFELLSREVQKIPAFRLGVEKSEFFARWLIGTFTTVGDVVLNCLARCGDMATECERLHRHCISIEKDVVAFQSLLSPQQCLPREVGTVLYNGDFSRSEELERATSLQSPTQPPIPHFYPPPTPQLPGIAQWHYGPLYPPPYTFMRPHSGWSPVMGGRPPLQRPLFVPPPMEPPPPPGQYPPPPPPQP
ncbi:hypothetical protein L7F22_046653 [Adiantum nelumboides]|nr:hypothetical protein [Adiantum nelumboides]